MPASGRAEGITHRIGSGGRVLRRDRECRDSPCLIKHTCSSSPLGVLWKNSSVTELLVMCPRRPRWSSGGAHTSGGRDPEIDATRACRDFRVALDGAAAFECIANHLLAEPIERR